MTNLSLKYIGWRSHNAIVGETPYVAARTPQVIAGITTPEEDQK